jgi:hypothetical protein
MPAEVLRSLARGLGPEQLERLRTGGGDLDAVAPVVLRGAGPVRIDAFAALMKRFMSGAEIAWPSRPKSDVWLAPRVHWALRLHRSEAADRGIWAYLANAVCVDYVAWRWGGEGVADNRWDGPHHKHALARLWWGAELFRNGPDYTPVATLFSNQDFPNSYIHRVFSRTRPMALGLLEAIKTSRGGGNATSNQINDVARKVNLYTGALALEAATGCYRDDVAAYRAWVEEGVPNSVDLSRPPEGPNDGLLDAGALTSARAIGDEICRLAGVA